MCIVFKKLSECQITDIITAWNRGFEGYFVKLEMSAELFFARLVNEGLSMNLSIVAFDGDQPVAIVLNGVRLIDGKKTAWNGGTGVAAEYRGKGVSKLLMEETLRIYAEEGVEVATLEAIKENERAIRLYQRYGYEIVDSLVHLKGSEEFESVLAASIWVKSIRPEQLATLSFYKENVPWQCQWQSVRNGEAQIFYGTGNDPLGYCLFKRIWNEHGKVEKVVIYQLELFSEVNKDLLKIIFASICGGAEKTVNFMTVNASISSPIIAYLMSHGFNKMTEQVQMVKFL
ncbi:GNAT family N-acetyltransferase [Neobacillus citreus]|uniref:GNAT family N-acetyltransferase n=1 Tax=Neobacillus citreus TaxID=2833578 RepID=A0A9J6MK96_9BACI|nr:GNAT family N-acetyltransferase [Neobacillus citreus]MCH6263936.1 GNAT family N-acetyltransferase [Neobacillus citreus]